MTTYDIGDRVTLTANLSNIAGTLTNPTTTTLTVRKPDGTTLSPSTSNPSTGVFTADVDVDQAGEWNYRWQGTGALVVAEEERFYVRPRRV